MADVCAYRAGGAAVAAKAAYVEYMGGGDLADERWEAAPDDVKDMWRDIFRAGHRAYREYIRRENRLIHDVSVAETLAHLENAHRNSGVAHN